jgi:hypothetical protein
MLSRNSKAFRLLDGACRRRSLTRIVRQKMNQTQKAIVATWVILAGGAICIVCRVSNFVPFVLLLYLFVRRRFVDEEAALRTFFSDRYRRTIALLACSILPWTWFIYRLLSTPSLPDSIGRELLALSIPLLVIMAFFDRWLYLRSMRDLDLSPDPGATPHV